MSTAKPEFDSPLSAKTQIGPFAIVPLWLLQRCADPQAIRLYAWLAVRYADKDHLAWPTQASLRSDLDLSRNTVKRSIQMLRTCGALVTRRRHRENGSIDGLEYLLIQLAPKGGPTEGPQGEPKSHVRAQGGPKDGPAIKEERDPVQPDPSTARKASPKSARSDVLVPPPQPGTVFNGYPPGEGPPSRTAAKRAKAHASHIFCHDAHCITVQAHAKNLQRLIAAGLKTEDVLLAEWYESSIPQMADEGTTEPGLWLYKKLGVDIAALVGQERR